MAVTFDDNLDSILGGIRKASRRAVKQTVAPIAKTAESTAPKDTTSLAESVYVVTDGSTLNESGTAARSYEKAVSEARAVNPDVQLNPPATIQDFGPDIHQGIVDVAAEHGSYVHNGYRNVPGRPFLEEAGDTHAGDLEKNLKAELKNLEK